MDYPVGAWCAKANCYWDKTTMPTHGKELNIPLRVIEAVKRLRRVPRVPKPVIFGRVRTSLRALLAEIVALLAILVLAFSIADRGFEQ
jgi:hypothetical protein